MGSNITGIVNSEGEMIKIVSSGVGLLSQNYRHLLLGKNELCRVLESCGGSANGVAWKLASIDV